MSIFDDRRKGVFIALEGIDGTGKSTLSKFLKEKIEEGGHQVHTTMEPTGTWLGKAVKKSAEEKTFPQAELMLFLADRCEHTRRIVEKLNAGIWVISDRYKDSSTAYQGVYLEERMGGLKKSAAWIDELNDEVSVEPDLTFLLDAAPDQTLKRLGNRKREKFEEKEYLSKVRKIYLLLAEEKHNIVMVDARKGRDEVARKCWETVEEKFFQ